MTTIWTSEFKTPLGIIQTCLQSDKPRNVIILGGDSITTLGHNVQLQSFELKNEWTPEHMSVESSMGWRWFINKTNDELENIILMCRLLDPTHEQQSNSEPGEHLESIEIEDGVYQLHIGTEDGDIMQARALSRDCMPLRFQAELGIDKSFTEYMNFGFKTMVPSLEKTETVYFHYLVATNRINRSSMSGNGPDCSTWFAVDQHKTFLDENLGMRNFT